MNAPRKYPPFAAQLLAIGIVVLLVGCPPSGGGTPERDEPTTSDGADASSNPPGEESTAQPNTDSATSPGAGADNASAKSTQPLDDAAREKFIAEMRELGVSVEQNDDGHIISLVMGFTEVDDEKLAQLPALPQLEFIGLDHTNITDEGLAAIAGRTSLKAIQLGGNGITAGGLKHLSGLKNLEHLDLSDLSIGDDALAHFENLKALNKLNLSQTNVTLEGTIHFAKAFDDLEISAPFGNLVGGRRLTMSPGVEDQDLAKLKSLDSLRELDLWECDNITNAGLDHVVALKQLTALELGYTKITDEGLAKLTALENLQQLDVRETDTSIPAVLKLATELGEVGVLADWGTVQGATGVRFTPDVTNEQLATLSHLPQLEHLNLWRCDKITDDGMAHVAKCRKLRELNLGATNVGDEGLKQLTTLPQLQRLVLANTPITSAGAEHLEAFKMLNSLDLSSTKIGDDGLQNLAALTNLQTLSLARTPISDAGLAELSPLERLEALDLQETSVNGEFLTSLAGELPNLKTFDLSLTLINDDALPAIGKFKSLETLELWGTQITDEGLAHLHDSSLMHLGLFGTQVSKEAVEKLGKELPEIDVTRTFDGGA